MAVDGTTKIKSIDVQGDPDVLRALKGKTGKTALVSSSETNTNLIDTSTQGALLDTINLDIGKAINDQIDPSLLLRERKDKIAKLKEQIANGTYKPTSEAIAASVNDEILQEILLSGSKSSTGGNSDDSNL